MWNYINFGQTEFAHALSHLLLQEFFSHEPAETRPDAFDTIYFSTLMLGKGFDDYSHELQDQQSH